MAASRMTKRFSQRATEERKDGIGGIYECVQRWRRRYRGLPHGNIVIKTSIGPEEKDGRVAKCFGVINKEDQRLLIALHSRACATGWRQGVPMAAPLQRCGAAFQHSRARCVGQGSPQQ